MFEVKSNQNDDIKVVRSKYVSLKNNNHIFITNYNNDIAVVRIGNASI